MTRTASLIAIRRGERKNCLLLDNGDFLQGTPIGDFAARSRDEGRSRSLHPAIAAMNALKYDAAALGNHDFSFGLPYLRSVTARANFPFLAANMNILKGSRFERYVILHRQVTTTSGHTVPLKIGVVGFLPPQTTEWDGDLSVFAACQDIVQSARQIIPNMKANGAQIIVALAHTGIGSHIPVPKMENAATALAEVDGIDVIVAGHTHELFPHPDFPAKTFVDPIMGTLCGKPAVMAGFGGSHLGVIDLRLARSANENWKICGFDVRCEKVEAALPSNRNIERPVMAMHQNTIRHLRRRVGRLESPLNSYFSLIGHDPGLRLINMAQRWYVRSQLRETAWERLPLLSAAAPFRAGGRGGPDHYTDVAAGRLNLRNLADLYVFPNRICAIRINGAQLRDWLERSVSLFKTVTPGSNDTQLMDPAFPCYNFDVVDGVTWQVDLSQPARFAPDGQLIARDANRITDLMWQDQLVQESDQFVLATNSFRLASCGLFSPLVSNNQVALKDDVMTRDILRHYVRRRRRINIAPSQHWHFRAMAGTSVVFESGPGSLSHLDAVSLTQSRRLDFTGHTPEGFARFRLHL
nr:bifunctional 2',3'-cyclic-nucleotide 2'-phosphodiesterase/3'-nucleotidase [Paracoccus amoyensis]